jgi:hypothetical protein
MTLRARRLLFACIVLGAAFVILAVAAGRTGKAPLSPEAMVAAQRAAEPLSEKRRKTCFGLTNMLHAELSTTTSGIAKFEEYLAAFDHAVQTLQWDELEEAFAHFKWVKDHAVAEELAYDNSHTYGVDWDVRVAERISKHNAREYWRAVDDITRVCGLQDRFNPTYSGDTK